ncbi:hypothetical protein PENSPDRAFT_368477 [Peniophora sp. CONT]|nr:hypothetical protein PENSPDRAFT_368477 [Peniophora sp. CONT]
MVLITCNAIGDILAVAQLIRDIARALDDARGAAAEYQRLVLQLSIVGTVMEEAHRIADASREDALKTALLAAVRLCHIDIVNASKLLPGYENLSRPTTIGGWTLSRARTSAKKLKWHLLKASDAAILADRLQTSQLRMNSIVVCMNRSSILRNLGQLAGAVGGLSAVSEQDHIRTREEIARSRYHLSKELQDLSASSNIQNANLKQSLHDSTRAINDALQELQTHSRHSASALHQDIVKMALKFSATSSARDRASVERVSDAVINRLNPEGSTLELERQRFLSSLVPFAIVGVTFVAHANIDPRWQTTALWATVCALIMHVLRLQSSPPPSVWRVSENVIILIDALGDRMPIALQLCTSLEHFHSFIENYYTTHERPGQHLVQRGYYELYKAENSEIITSVSWSQHITPGAKIEMGILLRRAGLGLSATIVCPWCKKETYGDGSSTLLSWYRSHTLLHTAANTIFIVWAADVRLTRQRRLPTAIIDLQTLRAQMKDMRLSFLLFTRINLTTRHQPRIPILSQQSTQMPVEKTTLGSGSSRLHMRSCESV